jgi:hypothetical protein
VWCKKECLWPHVIAENRDSLEEETNRSSQIVLGLIEFEGAWKGILPRPSSLSGASCPQSKSASGGRTAKTLRWPISCHGISKEEFVKSTGASTNELFMPKEKASLQEKVRKYITGGKTRASIAGSGVALITMEIAKTMTPFMNV